MFRITVSLAKLWRHHNFIEALKCGFRQNLSNTP